MNSPALSADTPPNVPRRPRWRPDIPLLWRDASTVQIGDHPARLKLSRADAMWLVRLEGLATYTEVLDTHPDAARLIRIALSVGALEDSAEIPPAARWASTAERDLAWARIRALPGVCDDPYARDRARVAVVGHGQVAEAVRTLVSAAGLRESGSDCDPTIVILADAPHPDVPQLFDGRALDGPHVHVGARGRRAVVGPIVVPGVTSCLRCAHLHACDRDSSWPMLSIQWAQTPLPLLDPLLVHLAAAHAVLMTRRFVDGCATEDTAFEIDLGGDGVRYVDRPPHALCGCRWPEPDPVSAGVR